jgi:acetolactate synthase-1/2/3 large subunit
VDEQEIRAAWRRRAFRDDRGLDALSCAELICSRLPDGGAANKDVACELTDEILGAEIELTGAETVAVILEQHGVSTVFAYAGTSELALCDSVDRALGISLVNGRGDKECAFMATGASLMHPNRGVAILHGARGLTNAAGGVADARRNEVGTLFIVGLPSTSSARFLPPHGEQDLISSFGNFAEWSWEAPTVPEDGAGRLSAAAEFISKLRSALVSSAAMPARPSIFGIPQDVAEARWVPLSLLRAPYRKPRPHQPSVTAVTSAVEAICDSSRPLFLVDDYALRYVGLREALAVLTELLGAPVVQLRYRRGPMLFERLRQEEVGNFLGWFNQFSAAHRRLFSDCDLFITVEDRNIYQRVVGALPACRKIAINGDGSKALKNEYLEPGDVLLEGNVTGILLTLADELTKRNVANKPWFDFPAEAAARTTPEPASKAVEHMRTRIVHALASILRTWDHPVLIDDSQMFGGLIAEHYELLPPDIRVFGDHGGFVGGGLACATGLAISQPQCGILCLLGDQGFTNSLQGLVPAVQEQVRVVFLVCNNGASISLKKQAAASGANWFDGGRRPYLQNVPGLSYRRVAEAIGVRTWFVEVPPDLAADAVDDAVCALSRALSEADAAPGPALIELKLPPDLDAWRGIWLTRGFEQMTVQSSTTGG